MSSAPAPSLPKPAALDNNLLSGQRVAKSQRQAVSHRPLAMIDTNVAFGSPRYLASSKHGSKPQSPADSRAVLNEVARPHHSARTLPVTRAAIFPVRWSMNECVPDRFIASVKRGSQESSIDLSSLPRIEIVLLPEYGSTGVQLDRVCEIWEAYRTPRRRDHNKVLDCPATRPHRVSPMLELSPVDEQLFRRSFPNGIMISRPERRLVPRAQ